MKKNRFYSSTDVLYTMSIVGAILYFILLPFYLFDFVSFEFNGFGVDSSGRLYVGRGYKIEVYDSGEKINVIRVGSSGTYAFTVQENDTILLAKTDHVIEMDLQGQEIQSYETDDRKLYNRLESQKNEFTTAEGETYTARSPLGMFTIYHGETVVYCMPIFDYVAMILMIYAFPMFLVFVFMSRKRWNGWLAANL